MVRFGDNSFIHLTVPGQPMGKQRSRGRNIQTKDGRNFNINYTPKKTVNYETLIQELFITNYPAFVPLTGAISIDVMAYLSIPVSKSKKQKELMRNGKVLPTTRPDVDNIQKIVFDALQKLAFLNDSQIIRSSVKKIYSDQPRVEIVIGEI